MKITILKPSKGGLATIRLEDAEVVVFNVVLYRNVPYRTI